MYLPPFLHMSLLGVCSSYLHRPSDTCDYDTLTLQDLKSLSVSFRRISSVGIPKVLQQTSECLHDDEKCIIIKTHNSLGDKVKNTMTEVKTRSVSHPPLVNDALTNQSRSLTRYNRVLKVMSSFKVMSS